MRDTRNIGRTGLLAGAFAIALMASLWSIEGARAQAPSADAETACRPDVFRLCEQFIPNRAPITQCLKRNVRNLSAECRPFFVKGKAKRGRKVRRSRRR